MSHKARIRMSLFLEYEAGAWGDDCTLGRLREQAKEAARGAANKLAAAAASRERLEVHGLEIDETVAILVPEDGP
jgi:hypothetical protein